MKNKLGLKTLKSETLNLNTFGNKKFAKRECELTELHLQGRGGEDVKIAALSFEAICSPLPASVCLDEHSHLLGLDLADHVLESDSSESNIDVLIGSDYYWDVVTGDIERGDGQLVAVRSKFGWLVSGPVRTASDSANYISSNLIVERPCDFVYSQTPIDELIDSLKRFWDIETVGIAEKSGVSPDEQFLRGIKFDKAQGRYEVNLPWRELTCHQSNNYDLCVSRINCLRSRLKKDEKLFHEYDSIFRAQIEAGIIECVPESETKFEGAQFLPHHRVLRDDRQTTKLRIVFDGSARADQNQFSLNDCLEKGPNLTPHIFDVLTKFRGYPVGLIADIEKAFHQISVNPADRDKLRFLWFKNIEGEKPEIVQYRFCRLVFGLTSSPAILNGTVQHHLSQYKQSEPQVAELLANSLYVDDFPGGASDDESAFHVY